MTIREKARKARCAEGLWLASLLGLGLFVLPLAAHAKEKVLLLSVLKEGRPDPKLLRVAQDRLQKTGEQLVQSNDLSNTERKCMQQDCLLALAASKGADVVLAGTVQKGKGGSQSLGVLLYDFGKMKASELSGDCDKCTPETTTQRLHELFVRALSEFRGAAPTSQAPLVAKNDKPQPGAEGQAQQTQANAQTDTGLKQPFPVGPAQAQAQVQPILPPQVQARPGEEPLAVVTGGPLPPKTQPVEPDQKSNPAIDIVQKQPQTVSHGLQLSPRRKILAGVFGGLALGSLVAAVALTATDGNTTSMDCSAAPGVPKVCVLDNKVPSSIGYVAAGAFTVGTVLTLLWPESKPVAKESTSAEAAK
ncbi:MAG TPA: hypothetical protein PKO07_06400 [Pseudomonadota bacterium]|nr:hypothetical protein [Pseudomonadota bacterium]HNN50634.1 hypothetical protein [Pseudomonadota bacterium]